MPWVATCDNKNRDGSLCPHIFPTNPPKPEDIAAHHLEAHPHGLDRLTTRTFGRED